jgi:predicted DNA-binding transcriptional regulator AlpA
MNQELLTVAQFKERYQLSHAAFYRQVKSGCLPIIKIGRSTRIRLDDAQTWLSHVTGAA